MTRWSIWRVALPLALSGCSVVGGFIGDIEGAIGTSSDGSCDRRYGASPNPQPFCQEIQKTIAVSHFGDDCTNHLQGLYAESLCPRADVIAGCEYDKTNDDGSHTIDWYYDVSALIDAGETFDPRSLVHTQDDVRALCADPSRYGDGAYFVGP